MATKKISDFSEAAAFEDTDLLLVSKSKTTYTVAGQKIKDYSKAAAQTQAQETAKPYADAAAASASDANAAKTTAETAKTNAQTAASDAASAKAAAQTAQSAAENAKTGADSANTAAQQAAAVAQAAAAAMQECAEYSASKAYVVGNMATYNGSTYRCTVACTGVVPTTTANWLLIAAKGTDGTGTGDMQSSVYDPAGGAKQVAFSDHTHTAAQVGLGAVENKALSTVLNRTTNVNVADANYTTLMARGMILMDAATYDAVTDWTTVLVNGAIALRYE